MQFGSFAGRKIASFRAPLMPKVAANRALQQPALI